MAQANSTDVAEVRQQMTKMGDEFMKALPSHIPPERFERVVMTAIQNNPDLLNCRRQTLFNAAMKAAQDGLLPDGREGAMVPYKGEVTWMPMIAGIRKKVRNSGEIATWDVQAVYANDTFDFELGDDPFIKHKPALKERGEIIAVYSIATLKSGEKSRDVMGIEDVEKIRAISRAPNGPWKNPTFYPEMAKKTVARRHSKVLPMSSDLDDLIRRDDHLYETGPANVGDVTPRPRSLANRLDALAAPEEGDQSDDGEVVDPTTGEITGGQMGEDERQNARDNAEDVGEATGADGVSESDVKRARAAGVKAATDGKKRRDMPKEYRASDTLSAVWVEGFEEGAEKAAKAAGQNRDA